MEKECIERRPSADEAKTSRTIRNIRNTLRVQLMNEYNKTEEEADQIIEGLLSIHGLGKDNLDTLNMIDRIMKNRINDTSIDSNANKQQKTVLGSIGEATNPYAKLIGYDYLYRQMKEDWGKEEAKHLSGLLYDYSLAINDSTKILLPYCWSFNAMTLVFNGREYGTLHSSAPKRITSYIAALTETVHEMSNNLAGAIALGTLFPDMAYILINREHVSLEKLKSSHELYKYVENCFQTFVHSVNHLSRSSNESPFTNVSIFDRPKLRALFGEEGGMGWLFDTEEGHIDEEYFFDYVDYLQTIFLDLFDKGDPLSGGMPYRFPVTTINISKHRNEETGEIEVDDKKFLKKISKREIYRYNIFSSTGSKVASCCRLINSVDLLGLGSQVNSFGGTAISMGSHRVVTLDTNRFAIQCEEKTLEEFDSLLGQRLDEAMKVLVSHRHLLQNWEQKGAYPFITNGFISIKKMFSTIGLIGITETVNTFNKLKSEDSKELTIEHLLTLINKKVTEMATTYGYPINIEQIPGEAMAPRLVKADKLLFGEEYIPYTLYSNQFVPLWEDATIFERMSIDGKYNLMFTGGGIVHFNLGEKTTSAQNEELIKYAIKCGCEHFALNAVYSQCENEHTQFGNLQTCPQCGAPIKYHLTRVVGFFTRVENWNPVRRDWEFPKRKFRSIPSAVEIDKEIDSIK